MTIFHFSLSNFSSRRLMRGKRTCSMKLQNCSGGITIDSYKGIFALFICFILVKPKLFFFGDVDSYAPRKKSRNLRQKRLRLIFYVYRSCIFVSLEPNGLGRTYRLLVTNFRSDLELAHLCLRKVVSISGLIVYCLFLIRVITNFSNPNYA